MNRKTTCGHEEGKSKERCKKRDAIKIKQVGLLYISCLRGFAAVALPQQYLTYSNNERRFDHRKDDHYYEIYIDFSDYIYVSLLFLL